MAKQSSSAKKTSGMSLAMWLIPLAVLAVVIIGAIGVFVLRGRNRGPVVEAKKNTDDGGKKAEEARKKQALDEYLAGAVTRDGVPKKAPSERPIGKIVVCRNEEPYESEAMHTFLPPTLAAQSPDEVDAIAVLIRGSQTVGYYKPIGAPPDAKEKGEPAEHGSMIVEVIEPGSGALIFRSRLFWGPSPASMLHFSTKPGPIEYPVDEVMKYLLSLPRKKQ